MVETKRLEQEQVDSDPDPVTSSRSEWDTCTMGAIGNTYGGLSGKSKDDFGIGAAQYVTFLNVLENVRVDPWVFERVRVERHERQNRVQAGDLLFNGTSETPDELAMGALVDQATPDLYLNSFCFGFRIRDRRQHDGLFLAYMFRGPFGRERLFALAQGATRYNLSKAQFKRLEFPIPDPDEQRAIAAALADVDGVLGALAALIAKKRAIKQAAMQQLLTGRTRLPGFAGRWEVKRLGDVAHIKTGKKNNEDKNEDGRYPFFVRSQVIERIDTYSFDGEAILVPGEGGIGTIIHYIRGKLDYHQRVYKISSFASSVSGKYVYYCMALSFNDQATKHSVKATVDSLRLPTFQEFEFEAPSVEEQTAIAAVLSDMDAEIEALEGRREKTEAIKRGMMQALLTGRVRLDGLQNA